MTPENDIARQSLCIFDPGYKLLSSQPRPEFMLIGSAKCGTTSFSSYLPLHPQVKPCVPKEPNFWSWRSCTRDQYQQLFVNATPAISPGPTQQIGGEYSTSSLLHPLVPRRVRARLPDVKIIVLLRNPIDRAYSHFIMAQRNGGEPDCSFEEIVEREIEEIPELLAAHRRGFLDANFRTSAHRCHADGSLLNIASHRGDNACYSLSSEQDLFRFYVTSYVFRSIYYDQLRRWLELFPREQILILDSERLLQQREDVMREAVAFLGLQSYDFGVDSLQHTWGGGANKHNTPGDYLPISASARTRLSDFFAPHNKKLFDLIGESYEWE
ncbi:MAG: sulfotransferase domain-containing protein [Proteobacteria bacterium]|nr:sulfotransferase domain-containing protein [Pseudomonadota bacterium]